MLHSGLAFLIIQFRTNGKQTCYMLSERASRNALLLYFPSLILWFKMKMSRKKWLSSCLLSDLIVLPQFGVAFYSILLTAAMLTNCPFAETFPHPKCDINDIFRL